MKLPEVFNAVVPVLTAAVISGGVSWVVATRYAVADAQIVVIDVSAAMRGIEPRDPQYREKVDYAIERSRQAADRYAALGYIVLDGRGVARVPQHLLIDPLTDPNLAAGDPQ